ncbi:hypothetical protein B0H13DRAFT_1909246 [Mycena leptocephala]|nr:hypothetical protein B0H13DRAFT_1909246 [Mycena leptocephala]
MPCGAYADDRVTPPLVPTQHASPTNSIMQETDADDVALPTSQEGERPQGHPRWGLGNYMGCGYGRHPDLVHEKRPNIRPMGMSPLFLEAHPLLSETDWPPRRMYHCMLYVFINYPNCLMAFEECGAAATQSPTVTATMQDGPLNIEATDHSQAATTTTQDGPLRALTPGPTFEKSKEKSKSTGSPLDSALKGFSETDLVYYNHIGLTPPVCGDSAAAFRERVTQNEMKTERKNSTAIKYANSRLREFAKLMADFESYLALHNAVSVNRETIKNLLDALPSTEFYDEIEELTTNVEELQKKANDADRVEVCTEIAALKELAGTTNPPAAVSSAFTPAPPVTAANKPWRPRIRVKKPIVYSSFPSPVADEPLGLTSQQTETLRTGANFPWLDIAAVRVASTVIIDRHARILGTCKVPLPLLSSSTAPSPVHRSLTKSPKADRAMLPLQPWLEPLPAPSLNTPKRGAPAKYAPRNKRARLDAHSDIVYGPVPVNGALRNITDAAIQFLVQAAGRVGEHAALGMDDVVSTQVARGHANKISIRFRSRKKADAFASLVQRFTPIPGQTAFHSEAPTHGGTSAGPLSTQALLNILQGIGNQAG